MKTKTTQSNYQYRLFRLFIPLLFLLQIGVHAQYPGWTTFTTNEVFVTAQGDGCMWVGGSGLVRIDLQTGEKQSSTKAIQGYRITG